nr:MAG TPA: hypothetical protein [Caudoviricetes sp.]
MILWNLIYIILICLWRAGSSVQRFHQPHR